MEKLDFSEWMETTKELIEQYKLISKHLDELIILDTIYECVYEMRKLVEDGNAPEGFDFSLEELEKAEEYSSNQTIIH